MLDSSKFSEKLSKELVAILPKEAIDWLVLLSNYAHLLDDIIDEKEFQNVEKQMELQYLSLVLYNNDFYHKYSNTLLPILINMHNTYHDSMILSNSDTSWKKNLGNSLRQCGNEVVCMLVLVFGGYDAMRKISMMIREDVNNRQGEQ